MITNELLAKGIYISVHVHKRMYTNIDNVYKVVTMILCTFLQSEQSARTFIKTSHPSQPTVVSLDWIWWSFPS